MDKEALIFEQYKLYTEQKERFIDRSFTTNKFYLILVLTLVLLVFITHGLTFGKVTPTMIYSIAGIIICVLWWINMDSYNFLIKIKFQKVIEELEKNLPVMPYTMEFKAIKDFRKNKKMFLFTDMQKMFAVLSFLMFFVLFMVELVPMIVKG